MARQLAEAGVTLVPFGRPADLYLINSCTVTHVGDRKSRQLIRQAVRTNPGAFVAVAGCYAELEGDAVRAMDGVDAVLGNHDKGRLLEVLREHSLELGDSPLLQPLSRQGGEGISPSFLVGEGAGGKRENRTRAFVKVQEGCDNHCSYCIIPAARGHQRSRPADQVVEEIQKLVGEGHQEVVLTGVNITAYGRDWGSRTTRENPRGRGLLKLLERILSETELPRLRLSSLQPEDWSSDFYDLWGSGRLCRHLHLSLQSGSDSVLKRMRRRYNVDQYARIVAEARQALPGVAITTDVIVGFPGETEEEYRETENFLRSVGFAGLHVFKYSPRWGTAAASMLDQVDSRVKQERSERLIALAEEMGSAFRSRFVGSVLGVLWEERLRAAEVARLGVEVNGSSWFAGLSDNYLRVYAASPRDLSGAVGGARIERLAGEGVLGVPVR
jgi:threonylcarbamoyladenosine tRNA methylthiotransferase MtaB